MRLTAITVAILLTACAFDSDDAGDDETGGQEIADSNKCVEDTPGAVTCWTRPEPEADYLLVWLGCQIEAAQGVVLIDQESRELEGWGGVACYGVSMTDADVCFWGSENVLLTRQDGAWSPTIGHDIEKHIEAPPPC